MVGGRPNNWRMVAVIGKRREKNAETRTKSQPQEYFVWFDSFVCAFVFFRSLSHSAVSDRPKAILNWLLLKGWCSQVVCKLKIIYGLAKSSLETILQCQHYVPRATTSFCFIDESCTRIGERERQKQKREMGKTCDMSCAKYESIWCMLMFAVCHLSTHKKTLGNMLLCTSPAHITILNKAKIKRPTKENTENSCIYNTNTHMYDRRHLQKCLISTSILFSSTFRAKFHAIVSEKEQKHTHLLIRSEKDRSRISKWQQQLETELSSVKAFSGKGEIIEALFCCAKQAI